MPNNKRKSSPYYYREQIICSGCGKNFEKMPYLVRPTNYCSRNCYHKSTNHKHTLTCVKCKKTFKIKDYLVQQGYGQYCSRKCQHLDYPKQIIIKCEQCGKEINKPPSIAKLTHFCSKACHDLAMSDFEELVCAQCHKSFKLPTWETKKGKGKFCSRECFIKFSGESSLEEKVRHYLEDHGIKFIQEKKFGKYRADFTIENLNLIIECDGEFWHLRPYSKKRDLRKNMYLESLGYHVARLTGRQINEHWPQSIQKVFDNIFRSPR